VFPRFFAARHGALLIAAGPGDGLLPFGLSDPIRDGKAAEAQFRKPFDVLFSSRRFEYGDLAWGERIRTSALTDPGSANQTVRILSPSSPNGEPARFIAPSGE
jgi:hypothetical protein